MTVHHIDRVKPKEVQPADLYNRLPTRFGAYRKHEKFVESLPATGSRYAVFATHTDGAPDKKTGRLPTQEELDREKDHPELDQLLKDKGLIRSQTRCSRSLAMS